MTTPREEFEEHMVQLDETPECDRAWFLKRSSKTGLYERTSLYVAWPLWQAATAAAEAKHAGVRELLEDYRQHLRQPRYLTVDEQRDRADEVDQALAVLEGADD